MINSLNLATVGRLKRGSLVTLNQGVLGRLRTVPPPIVDTGSGGGGGLRSRARRGLLKPGEKRRLATVVQQITKPSQERLFRDIKTTEIDIDALERAVSAAFDGLTRPAKKVDLDIEQAEILLPGLVVETDLGADDLNLRLLLLLAV